MDYVSLQQDIVDISAWSTANLLSFNLSKCKFMLVSHNRHPSYPSLSLHGVPIDRVTSYKYLGVLLSLDLSWSPHVERQCATGKRLLGLLYHQFSKHITESSVLFRLFCSLVRPHLEYAAQVWNPYLVKGIERLEGVQKFALRLCSRSWNADYADLLEVFHVPSLKGRRLFLSLLTLNFYKIVKEFVFFPPDSVPLPVSRHGMLSRTFHPSHFCSPITRLNERYYSFLFACVKLWNCLPIEAFDYHSFKKIICPLFL